MRRRVLAASAALVTTLTSCLGSGTRRIDAPCREMSSAIVYEMLKDNPTVLVLDVRNPESIETEGRIRNERSFPLEQLASPTFAELDRYKETTVVVFGHDGPQGRKACEALSTQGFKYVIFISDGAAGWFANGLPGVRRPMPAAP